MVKVSRRVVMMGMGLTAGIAGAGLAWCQHRAQKPQDDALAALWALQLELPKGGSFEFNKLRGKPLLVNFWATWCPPCVEELPLLERFYLQNVAKNWQVVGLAVDNNKAVNKFLAKMPLSFPTPIAGLGGTDLSRSLGNLSGGLPFTVVVSAAGEVVLRHMGKLSAEQLDGFSSLR
jgi:thiol-disulfide isomerase/thioredoxin